MCKLKLKLYIDMDDTVCNFTDSFNRLKTDKNHYPQQAYGFFRNLEPIKDALYYISLLEEKYDIWFLTRPSVLNPLCYTEKREWIEKYFGIEKCHKLILSPDKSLLKGEYLIDDNYHNFDGELLLFGKDYPNWESVYFYLINKEAPSKTNILDFISEIYLKENILISFFTYKKGADIMFKAYYKNLNNDELYLPKNDFNTLEEGIQHIKDELYKKI